MPPTGCRLIRSEVLNDRQREPAADRVVRGMSLEMGAIVPLGLKLKLLLELELELDITIVGARLEPGEWTRKVAGVVGAIVGSFLSPGSGELGGWVGTNRLRYLATLMRFTLSLKRLGAAGVTFCTGCSVVVVGMVVGARVGACVTMLLDWDDEGAPKLIMVRNNDLDR